MSFLLDPPLLFASGVLIERALPQERRDVAEAATLGVFFGGSFGLYNNVPGLGLLWRPFRARNGRDFMWNSGVFGVNTQRRPGVAAARGGRGHLRDLPVLPQARAKARAPQVSSLASFGTALLPEEHGGPSPTLLVDRVDRYLARMPSTTRLALRAGLLSVGAASYLTTGRPLSRLSPSQRDQVLRRVAALSPDASAAVEAMKVIVLLANGADTYAPELLARAQKHDVARPDAALTITPSTESPSVVAADAVIVGSGAGGAMVARTLARAGLDVVVLEEGRRWTVEEFRSTHPIDRYAGLYRGAGATVALGRPSVVLPVGRAVGGTTVVNSGTCLRPPLAVQRRWRDEFGLGIADPDRLADHLDDVERTLQVAPVPLDIMGRNGRLLLDAAASLGWQAAPIPRNAPGCEGCCQCAIGCPRNAKSGVHLNALPQACAAGARIISQARVERVLHRARTRAWRAGPPARRHGAGRACGHGHRRRRRYRDARIVAAQQELEHIRGSAETSRCIRQQCWPGVSTTTSSHGAACCRAPPCTSSTSRTAC